MRTPSDVIQPRLILLGTGAVSVAMGLWHFATRHELAVDAAARATHDLNGLSMLFAGLVTAAVAWMAVSPQLLAGYAALYGVYYICYAWILLFAAISWRQATVAAVIAVAALFAASNAWAGDDRQGDIAKGS